MEIERIKFERTGGFAGMRFGADFELDDLPDEQARALTELIDDLDFDERPTEFPKSERKMESSASDQFTYTITVETKNGKRTLVTGDASADEKMQSLFELLTQIARKQMRKE